MMLAFFGGHMILKIGIHDAQGAAFHTCLKSARISSNRRRLVIRQPIRRANSRRGPIQPK